MAVSPFVGAASSLWPLVLKLCPAVWLHSFVNYSDDIKPQMMNDACEHYAKTLTNVDKEIPKHFMLDDLSLSVIGDGGAFPHSAVVPMDGGNFGEDSQQRRRPGAQEAQTRGPTPDLMTTHPSPAFGIRTSITMLHA
ncbi:hypothetical protein SCUP234_09766 [Seiridium cupressi]